MKKTLMTLIVGLFLVGAASSAHAVVIAPGVTALTAGVTPVYGAVLATTGNVAFSFAGPSATTITGTTISNVYQGQGGLLFEYTISTASSGDNSIRKMSAYSFGDFLVNADYDPLKITTPGHFPSVVENDFGTVYANFSHSLNTGESATLYIQTDAKYFTAGGYTLLGAGANNFVGFAPLATPEPKTYVLLAIGLLGLVAFRRKSLFA